MKTPVIEVRNLVKNFKVGRVIVRALRGVNFSLYPGEFLIIYGPSGCGKSTLLNMIAKLDDYDSGDIFIRGENIKNLKSLDLIKHRRSAIGMVFQDFNLIPSLSVLENVALPLTFSGIPKKERQKRAADVLETVGLRDKMNQMPYELSGGEQQRVAIARALALNPWILLVDEPTGNLDEKSGWEVIMVLSELCRRYKRTILLVTHNSAYFCVADRILHMRDGKIEREEIVPEKMKLKRETEEKSTLHYFIPSKIRNHMRITDVIRLAYKHFRYARSRSFLTVLGIVIGVAAIVLLVSLGIGLQKITTSRLANFEALQTISVAPPSSQTVKLDKTQVENIKKIEGVKTVSPLINMIGSGTLLGTTTSVTVTGIQPSNLKTKQVGLLQGRGFSEDDAKEAVVSKSALKAFGLDDGSQVLNQKLKLDILVEQMKSISLEVTVVGISDEKATPEIYLPISLLNKASPDAYTSLDVVVEDRKEVGVVKNKIEELGFQASSAKELIDQVDRTFLIIQAILGLIGAIGFFVASFGIVNTMTISLLEKTREIGVMKALGISNKDIKRVFVFEAILFGFLGGVFGILLGYLIGQGINGLIYFLMQKGGENGSLTLFVTPWKFALVVLFFSIAVAWAAGVYPAFRASKLSPLEALRRE